MSDRSSWQVVVTPRAERELRRLSSVDQARIRKAIDVLTRGPAHGDVKKLRGKATEWRLRVGDWRVRFAPDFEARLIVVLRVLPRGRAYRD